ncbi:energy transducer TonB [Colwellia psychrerythraea]|uniref:TonB family protein n=1 Tax=Colwellia psychrerythraea TaxID=28229 RepID=A0A099L625_COLPS|nr:energy transducer TonB [Colwellia psychrerythraea]KGJ97348.1 TonB family protein [Colwellia psychrerythraea]
MSTDKFDNEIAQLYQQRKQQIVVPKMKLQQEPSRHKYSPLNLLTLFLAGGMASFGIMAIVSHLSTSQIKAIDPAINSQAIKFIELAPNKPTEKTLATSKPLPPLPIVTSPETPRIIPVQTKTNNHVIKPAKLAVALIQLVTVPQLNEPKLIIKPIYKVLPEYPLDARINNQTGEVKLSYQIDTTGKVSHINIISSSVEKGLQRSAKKALAKWQYKPNAQLLGPHEIIFKFTAPKG